MSQDLTARLQMFLDEVQMPKVIDYTYWDNLKKRKIILNDYISDVIVESVIMQILKFNEEDDEKNLLDASRKPITIYLNTGGGQLDIGLVLCNVIQNSKTPVHIIAMGTAASMGSLILMSGKRRIAFKYTDILIHDGSMNVGGTTSQVKDLMRFQEEKEKQIKEFVLKNTKITSEKYDEMFRKEWWMTAQTALELGIIDEII